MPLKGIEGLEMSWELGLGPPILRHHMQDLPPEAAIAQERRHILMAGKTPMSILLPLEHRRLSPDGMIGRIRIIEEFRIARVKPHRTAAEIDFHWPKAH